MNKYLVIILGLIILLPIKTHAFDFGRIVDPACFFACDDDDNSGISNSYNTYTNNYNGDHSNYSVDNRPTRPGRPGRQPVYATPIYVYDDYDNRHRDNYPPTYYPPVYEPLGVSCYASITEAFVGDTIVWNASVYGGNGNYHITWSGSNGFSGTGSSATMRYRSGGSKKASVSVVSGNQTMTKNCGSILIRDYGNQYQATPVYNYYNNYNYDYSYYRPSQALQVTCYPSYSNVRVGSLITWTASAYGGNGNYRYSWFGNDGVYSNGSSASLQYNTPGSKTASVTVVEGGQRISKNCGYVSVY